MDTGCNATVRIRTVEENALDIIAYNPRSSSRAISQQNELCASMVW